MFSAMRSLFARRRTSRPLAKPRGLSLERLEAREVPAISVLAPFGSPTLTINADTNGFNNVLVFRQNNAILGPVLTVYNNNGQQISFVRSGPINNIVFNGSANGDVFRNSTDVASTIFGNGGNDTLIGGTSLDTISGGAGDDAIDGGDTLFPNILTETADANFTLANPSPSRPGVSTMTGLGNDLFLNITTVRLTGTGILHGDVFDVQNYTGSVVLQGGPSNDLFRLGSGLASIDGGDNGSGGDAVVMSNVSTALFDRGVLFARGTADTIRNIESLTINGTGGNDTIDLAGFGGQATVSAQGGDDIIRGGTGNDILDGGLGNNIILPSGGNDVTGGNSLLAGIVTGGDAVPTLGRQRPAARRAARCARPQGAGRVRADRGRLHHRGQLGAFDQRQRGGVHPHRLGDPEDRPGRPADRRAVLLPADLRDRPGSPRQLRHRDEGELEQPAPAHHPDPRQPAVHFQIPVRPRPIHPQRELGRGAGPRHPRQLDHADQPGGAVPVHHRQQRLLGQLRRADGLDRRGGPDGGVRPVRPVAVRAGGRVRRGRLGQGLHPVQGDSGVAGEHPRRLRQPGRRGELRPRRRAGDHRRRFRRRFRRQRRRLRGRRHPRPGQSADHRPVVGEGSGGAEFNDIAFGINGTAGIGYSKAGFNFSVNTAAASLVYTPGTVAFAGGSLNPLAGTPLAFINPGSETVSGTVSTTTGDFDVTVSASLGGLLGTFVPNEAKIHLTNEGVFLSGKATDVIGVGRIDVSGAFTKDPVSGAVLFDLFGSAGAAVNLVLPGSENLPTGPINIVQATLTGSASLTNRDGPVTFTVHLAPASGWRGRRAELPRQPERRPDHLGPAGRRATVRGGRQRFGDRQHSRSSDRRRSAWRGR